MRAFLSKRLLSTTLDRATSVTHAARLALFKSLQAAAAAAAAAPAAAASPSSPLLLTLQGLPTPLTVTPDWHPALALRALKTAGAPLPGTEADPIVAATLSGGPPIGLRDPLGAAAAAAFAASQQPLRLEFLTLSSREGQRVYWHSGAHVLGAALEAHFGPRAWLCDGPAVLEAEGGFFYELQLPPEARLSPAEAFAPLEAAARALVAQRAPFERLVVTRAEAAALFAGNPHKEELLNRIPSGETLTAYRCGPFVDLCRGPHVPHTGLLRALRLHKCSSSGKSSGGGGGVAPPPLLQRVHGIAFPTPAQLTAWATSMEEAKKRDHRVVGKAQELFFFHELSPGSAFMLPHGTRIINRLLELLRGEYRRRGYEEVATPLLFKKELWATSGHLEAYAEEMFSVVPGGLAANGGGCSGGAAAAGLEGEEEGRAVYGLKPMNCPGHCLVFAQRLISQRELPLRLADFSALHRNEASGALGGLTRLRRFSQDDAHVFCTEAQVGEEVSGCLDFVAAIYKLFGFSFRTVLSTRPPVFVGDEATWAAAEAALGNALAGFLRSGGGSGAFQVDAGGGAFYGPKVDVFVKDALGREHQCATVQLDFQLPRRFGLRYRVTGGSGGGEGGASAAAGGDAAEAVPVLIHRAVLGSLERMLGILTEHTAGKWPFWVSPRQILLCTVAERHAGYAAAVADALRFPGPHADTGLWVEVDGSGRTVGKKVREGQLAAHNLLLVLGDAEEAAGTASVRFRDAATMAAFGACWARVDAAAAGSAGAGGWVKELKAGGGGAGAFEGPLATLPLATLRSVCVMMQAERL